jgi:hypothetical protein
MADSVSTPFLKDGSNLTKYATPILLGIGTIGIVVITSYMGFLTQEKDKGNEIKLQLGIVFAITAVLCGVFAFVAYMYFSSYPAYLTNFILVMTFINLTLSVFAVGTATINVSTV